MHIIKILDGPAFVQVQKDRTLLEELEAHNIDVEYQCRQGYCGSCQMKLITGKVCYAEKPLAFVRANYILSCCCYVKTDIIIEI